MQYCTYFQICLPSFWCLSTFPSSLLSRSPTSIQKHRWGSESSLLTACQHTKNMAYTLGFHLKVTKFSQHTYKSTKQDLMWHSTDNHDFISWPYVGNPQLLWSPLNQTWEQSKVQTRGTNFHYIPTFGDIHCFASTNNSVTKYFCQ